MLEVVYASVIYRLQKKQQISASHLRLLTQKEPYALRISRNKVLRS